jgi:tetratricopeptide (TPR) repeat protein
VTIEGKNLKAGTYGLHMIIHEDGKATIIFSNNSTAWGSFFYEPSEDALRVNVQTNETPSTEQLTFNFINVDPTSATVVLNWEKKQIPFKIGVDVANVVLADMRQKLQNQDGFQSQNWDQAAIYALNNGSDLSEALGWINNSIEGQFYSKKSFNNLQIKSQILDKMGKNTDATAIMDEALSLATIFEVHQYGRTLIAQGKKDKALEVFKMNAEKNKNTWPVDYGLARGYSALGDYNKALKHIKIALSKVPDAANKAAIKTNIAKLEKGQDIN